MKQLFCDCKTDEEKENFFLSGRAVEAGIIAPAISNDVAMAYHRCAEFQKEIDTLRAKIEQMERQKPVAYMPLVTVAQLESGGSGVVWCPHDRSVSDVPVYGLPGAQAYPAPSTPDGWKLVPTEPTTDMICEMERQWMCGSQIDMAKREWKAACAAAPEAKP